MSPVPQNPAARTGAPIPLPPALARVEAGVGDPGVVRDTARGGAAQLVEDRFGVGWERARRAVASSLSTFESPQSPTIFCASSGATLAPLASRCAPIVRIVAFRYCVGQAAEINRSAEAAAASRRETRTAPPSSQICGAPSPIPA